MAGHGGEAPGSMIPPYEIAQRLIQGEGSLKNAKLNQEGNGHLINQELAFNMIDG